jgi:hypothetical protein
VAAIRPAAFHLEPVRDELHLGVTEREECIEVAPAEGVEARWRTSTFSRDIAYSDSPAVFGDGAEVLRQQRAVGNVRRSFRPSSGVLR